MKEKELEKIIDKNKNQVVLLNSRCSFPFWFVTHNYFLTNKKGKITRYEIAFENISKTKQWNKVKTFFSKENKNHIHINTRKPLQGINIFLGINWKWNVKIIGVTEGKIAEKIMTRLEKTPETYKDKNNYHILKSNCNTFAQRIIDQVPECKFKLPKNAIGKNKY